MPRFVSALLCLVSFGIGAHADPAHDVFHETKLREIDAAISLAISDGRCPGGVLWLERAGASYHRAYGNRALEPEREPMTEETIFDTASLTKIVATTTAVMKLLEQKKLELETPVSRFIPEFTAAGKEAITIAQLLTHTSGLRAGIPANPPWEGNEAAIALACAEPLPNPPGVSFRYSDINFILLGEIVRRVSGQGLEAFCAAEIFAPLKMPDTSFIPPEGQRARIAPTERTGEEMLRGVVHDPTARRMAGVAGHAGLFTTAADLARFARMLLAGGELDGARILRPDTVALMTRVQTAETIPARRGYGWDIDSPFAGQRGQWFPIGGYGHTGWTGGSFWVDPFSRTFIIFLSNRNHPTESGNVSPLRRTLGTLAAEAIRNFNFLHVPDALSWKPGGASAGIARAPREMQREVLCGIDVLARDQFAAVRGLKIGLITNHTGIDRQRRTTIDLLHKAPGVELVALFSPEHGIRGALDEKVDDSRDEKTGLPIYSLYGATARTPKPEQLAGVDALVFDIQDIGCRFYTYISTLGECLVAATNAGKKFIVLDRPNPISGTRVEGPMLAADRSFVAWHELPVRHGMTVGELAKLFAAERAPGADLTVIACEGWRRGAWFEETGIPWVNPSPNMRSLPAANLYPGVGLLEFCKVSVGRGTDRPFEMFGAPYLNDRELASALNSAALAGVQFIPVRFTPRASVFANQECGGVQMFVTDREAFSPVDLGMTLASIIHRLHPRDLELDKMARLLAHPSTLAAIKDGKPLSEIKTLWAEDRARFAEKRERFLIYR